jgi:hypothetical protein
LPRYQQTNFANLDLNDAQALVQDDAQNYLIAYVVLSYATNKISSCVSSVNEAGIVIENFCDTGIFEKTTIRDIVLNNSKWVAVGDIKEEATSSQYYSYYYSTNTENNLLSLSINTSIKSYANACVNTIDGGILLAGSMHNEETEPNSNELHLIKVDSLGVEQWHRTYYNFTKQNTYEDIIALPDGTFYGLATIKDDYWQQANIALLHLSATGIPISIQEYNLNGRDLARCLIPTNDGGILFSATSYPTNNEIRWH